MLYFYISSSRHDIDSSCAVDFLELLYKLKSTEPTKFAIEKEEYDRFLQELEINHCINSEVKNHYSKKMITDVTLEQRKKLAEQKKDFNEAIELAKIYHDYGNEVGFLYRKESVLHWVIKAIEYKGLDALQKAINLDNFLESFDTLYSAAFLFRDKNALPLLPIIKNILVKLDFGTFFGSESVNTRLTYFIANNPTLKELDLGTSPTWNYNIHAEDMHFIADGLKTNNTLEVLKLCDQRIGDEGLIILLDALASNPNTHLKILNLFCTDITSVGQQALEKFLETNETLEWVNVKYNHGVTSDKIDTLLARNRAAHAELLDPATNSLRMR